MKYYGMRREGRKIKTTKKMLFGVLFGMLMVFGATAQPVYATVDATQETVTSVPEQEQSAEILQQDKVSNENAEAVTDTQADASTTETTGGQTEEDEPAFTPKEGFVFFVCCAFSVILCVVIGIWGNPNDRLKDRYKRERRRQEIEAKKRIDREKREAKFAEEDARYAKELEEYEAAMKAKEEAKAAKKAEKAAKKAGKK